MLLQWIWFAMMAASLVFACASGKADAILPAAIQGGTDAILLFVNLSAGYLLFCGFIEILKAEGAAEALRRWMQPLLRVLMPGVSRDETKRAIAMNLSANLLGLGNAATPMGIAAMQQLDSECAMNRRVRHAMYMLLIVNATSIQLIPTTVLTLRVAAGSAQPNAVLGPSLLCTAASTLVGVALGLWCRRCEEKQHAK